MGWYRRVTRILAGNPVHRIGGRYIPYTGRHEALAIGLHQFYQLGLEMLQHTSEGAVVVQGLAVGLLILVLTHLDVPERMGP